MSSALPNPSKHYYPNDCSYEARQLAEEAEIVCAWLVSKRPAKIRRKSTPDPKARRNLLWIFAAVSLVVVIIFTFTWDWRQPVAFKSFVPVATRPMARPFKAPTTLDELVAMTPAELDHCDIALMNLLCTQGLPGAEKVNIPEMLATLDGWAAHVGSETQRNMHRFFADPKDFNNSEAYFRMMFFVTVLQEDYSVHYNPNLMDPSIPDAIFLADARNVFINGLVGPERTGTCSSMPVLYVAVARRLGYPLYLATAKGHLFTQWHDGNEHFNVEGTSWGFSDHSDDFYMKWPEPITKNDLQENRYLRPLSGAEELSIFLQNRGAMLGVRGDFRVALACYEKAKELTPAWPDVIRATKELEQAVENPPLQAAEIEQMNEEYRRMHGYDPLLPPGIEDPDPKPKMPNPVPAPSNSLIAQLSQNVGVRISTDSLPPSASVIMENILKNIPGTALPNGQDPNSIAPAYPQYLPQSSPDAYDTWPNLRPGQPPVWQNPRPFP